MCAQDDRLTQLRTADGVEGLHRLLVRWQVGGAGQHREAVDLFRRFHAENSAGAVETVLLLCTEGRWRRCTTKLIEDVAATGILDDTALDDLAGRVFWPDRPGYRHPLAWLGLDWVEVDLHSGQVIAQGTEANRTVVTERSPPPGPVRRWAAVRLLRRGATSVAAVLGRARRLDSHGAETVVAGILDAYDSLPPGDAVHALERGLASGRGPVRRQALALLAARDGMDTAARLARSDPDAQVRAWADAQGNAPSPTLF